ncbi:zinc-binding alcohol dehydrogenase family protein [Cyanobium sp. AMD-g]|uniref:zinc-binding alcohol dehydrogenase family protein n=1 Tax=Cyanobium sp. AMD-g TaxID=2823699 RepID=UPI0020CB782D|nr:zinc-binding alcohol dehydrogenase family protein [Cyanobium sp. AMD-g]MCP9929220.1 zinc-binding alcohol dehydrogenase family protein [Cyanobium sp. AMD-g]
MKAIAWNRSQSNDSSEWLYETEIETPIPSARALLVHVKAISVHLVDYKARASLTMQHPSMIFGWDASGIVEAVGKEVTLFMPGDEVCFVGSFSRAGSNSEYHVVDERIVCIKPTSLSFEQAAALPLTTITAWEALFERLAITHQATPHDQSRTLLIIGGAGGVGLIAIQFAKPVAGMRVIATASRPETINWCQKMGADHTINHHPFKSELATIGVDYADSILCLHDSDQYLQGMVNVIKPQGRICSSVGSDQPLDVNPSLGKSISFVWENGLHKVDVSRCGYPVSARVAESGGVPDRLGDFDIDAYCTSA